MKHPFDPRRLDVTAFAQESGTLMGEERLAHFDRLLDETRGLGAETLVHFEVQGRVQADPAGVREPWMHLMAHTSLTLICQRCLGPVDVPVEFERDFRFVATEELAEIEDEESEEDVLVTSRAFHLLNLVEDELLMDMPTSPKHEICPQPVKMAVADAGFDAGESEKPHPFAALAKLKKDGLG